MIVINDIKEIEKYRCGEDSPVYPEYDKIVLYNFTENGVDRADVTFKVHVPFGINELIDQSLSDEGKDKQKVAGYVFFAKNVVMEKGCGLCSIMCENFVSDGKVVFDDYISVKNSITCNEELSADVIIGKDICTKSMKAQRILQCKNLKTELLKIGRITLKNVNCNGSLFDE